MPADARIQESNPFVEIATHLFLEDLAGKVGVAGLNNFREAAAARIRVGEEAVRYEPVASAWVDGATQLPEGAKLESLLKRAGISHTKLGMLLRNHSDVWLLEPF